MYAEMMSAVLGDFTLSLLQNASLQMYCPSASTYSIGSTSFSFKQKLPQSRSTTLGLSAPVPHTNSTFQKKFSNLRSPTFSLYCTTGISSAIHVVDSEDHASVNNGNTGSSELSSSHFLVPVSSKALEGRARVVAKEFSCELNDYYEPKNSEFVVGVIVSVHENMLHVDIGAELSGILLKETIFSPYKDIDNLAVPRNPTTEIGTILFCEVTGRTISGRALLSLRTLARKIAWHRIRQMKCLNELIEVNIEGWSPAGLISRVEGLRAFLPRNELMDDLVNVSILKHNVGRQKHVMIILVDEVHDDLVISEREAWCHKNLRAGALLNGTVEKVFRLGALIGIKGAKRSGLMHTSNLTRCPISSVHKVLAIGEKVRVLVLKSKSSGLLILSIADLESEPGLFLSHRERVFSEAEEMAEKYRQRVRDTSTSSAFEPSSSFDSTHFDSEESMFSNWRWFRFLREEGSIVHATCGS